MDKFKKNGFTLVELLVVIAIITILAAALMPALMKAWNRGAYGSWTQQKNAIMGDVNCAAYFTFEEGPGTTVSYNTVTSNLAYAYSPDPGGGFIPDPPDPKNTIENLTFTFGTTLAPDETDEWNRTNSRFRGLKYGLVFNGNNNYVDCVANQRFDITGTALTVEAWIKPSPLKAGGVVSKSGAPTDYCLSINASGQILFCALTTSASPVTAGKWNHIVGTYDGTALNVYCNGIFIDTTSSAPTASNGALEIGRQGGSYFAGVIDEVAIYNIALSAEEIRRHYQSGNR